MPKKGAFGPSDVVAAAAAQREFVRLLWSFGGDISPFMSCQATGSTLKGPSSIPLQTEEPLVSIAAQRLSPRGARAPRRGVAKSNFSTGTAEARPNLFSPAALLLGSSGRAAVRFPCPNCHKKSPPPSLSALLFPISSVLSALHEETVFVRSLPADRDNVGRAATEKKEAG